ncbi:MAG: sulfatase [Thermoanaerobaculia bacterium]
MRNNEAQGRFAGAFRWLPLLGTGSLALLGMLACGSRDRAAGTFRPDLSGEATGTLVEPSRIRHEGVRIPAAGDLAWPLAQAAAGRLRFGWGSQQPGSATLTVRIEGAPPAAGILRTFATGGEIFFEDLELETDAPAVIHFSTDSPVETVISDLRIVQPSARNDALIVILLDTTRRDAIGLYGSKRPTTPHLDDIFARGWKAERAWSLASWTTPSVATLLTGMAPAALEDASGATLGIPPGVATLGNDFARAGWSTAHFNANPALNVENGFHRGFTAFYTPPYEISSMALPGSDMLARLPGWLRAHEGERFLLYLQLIEPHEPYGRPDRPKGQTPFDPDYTGRYLGDESHYALSFDATIQARDIEHLRALYDDDVRYGDLLIGQFWQGLDDALRRRATLVFVSDHGEEFLEHGGWKHGPSLYDEVLRVPLLVRPGNGRSFPAVPADTLVSLADLLPTLEHLLEVPLQREVDGVDLLEAKHWAREALPPIHMLTGGAARAVVVRKSSKLFFFDRFGTRGLPDERSDPMGHRVALHLREILPALGSFDLEIDPSERALLTPVAPGFDADWRAIETSLAHTRRGLEVRVLGGATAGRLQFTFAAGEGRAERFALEPQDVVQADAAAVRLDLDLPPGDVDGILFPESPTTRTRVTVSEGCLKWQGESLALGTSRDIETIANGVPRFTSDPNCAALFVWRNDAQRPARSTQEEDEERQKLRALGYIH